MFATLLGALPRPDEGSDHPDRLIEVAIRAQEEAGLEPITDGRLGAPEFDRLPGPDEAVDSWRAAKSMTDRAVKQALPGPYSIGGQAAASDVADAAQALADEGCPLVEIEETTMDRLADAAELDRFRDMHERLVASVTGTHLSLSIVGEAPAEATWATILKLPYASLAVDLIAGPDSWNLVTRWARERGVIVGVESGAKADEPKEALLWAAHYAASTQGRGRNRVGLGSAGSWANLTWDAAVRKMRLLGEAARLATMPPGEDLYRSLDPRAVSPRRAALGHDAPRPDV